MEVLKFKIGNSQIMSLLILKLTVRLSRAAVVACKPWVVLIGLQLSCIIYEKLMGQAALHYILQFMVPLQPTKQSIYYRLTFFCALNGNRRNLRQGSPLFLVSYNDLVSVAYMGNYNVQSNKCLKNLPLSCCKDWSMDVSNATYFNDTHHYNEIF